MFFGKNKNIIILVISFFLLGNIIFCNYTSLAYERASENYKIQTDSLNSGGLDESTSGNYKLKDTVGELATGDSNSENFYMHAGYRQMEETYISISVPGNINLSPNIGGLTGGSANGNGTWNVKTDNEAGYSMNIKASNTPAMQFQTYNFADYTPASTGIPDVLWDIGSANSEFGYAPYNASSLINKFKNNASICGAGTATEGDCWYGLSNADEQIVSKASRTNLTGEDTKIYFQAQVKSNGHQNAGNYVAPITITAMTN